MLQLVFYLLHSLLVCSIMLEKNKNKSLKVTNLLKVNRLKIHRFY